MLSTGSKVVNLPSWSSPTAVRRSSLDSLLSRNILSPGFRRHLLLSSIDCWVANNSRREVTSQRYRMQNKQDGIATTGIRTTKDQVLPVTSAASKPIAWNSQIKTKTWELLWSCLSCIPGSSSVNMRRRSGRWRKCWIRRPLRMMDSFRRITSQSTNKIMLVRRHLNATWKQHSAMHLSDMTCL